MIKADWRTPLIDFIKEQKLPPGVDPRSAEATQLFQRAKGYTLVGDKLYRHGAMLGVLMKCVSREKGKDILQEIHEGVCGNHVASRTLIGKASRSGYYWPTALADAEDLIR